MADELPPLRLAWNASSQNFSDRKRMRLSSPPASSDPAIFSSDDDPSADNYTQDRRKRKYRGPWYQQRLTSEAGDSQEQDQNKKSKRTFERKFDSGVFMGSDGTEIDDGEGLELVGPSRLPFRQPRSSQIQKPLLSPEDLAQQYIARCLDEGIEAIDLSSRGLTTISNATVRPLATFTRVPAVTEGVFTILEPRLKLFLASNHLTTLPAELFNLESLTALSLRANQLHELSPRISNLKKLKELNLSQNGLRYLPYEILDLFSDNARLQSLHLHPNVFHEPQFPRSESEMLLDNEVQYKIGLSRPSHERREDNRNAELHRRACHEPWNVLYKARTEVRFFDISGRLLQGPEFPGLSHRGSLPFKLPVADEDDYPEPPKARGNGVSRAPSLLEVALLACARSPQLAQLGSWLPEDCPSYLHDILDLAVAKRVAGPSSCTICKRNFIIARTEWIEWWDIAKVTERQTASAASPLRQMEERDALERMVPLMRRGCSWLCLPEKA